MWLSIKRSLRTLSRCVGRLRVKHSDCAKVHGSTVEVVSRTHAEMSDFMWEDLEENEEPTDAYTVTWGSGPLGLTFYSTQRGVGAFIKRISERGAAAHLTADCVGDALTFVNGVDVTFALLFDIVELIKSHSQPVVLVFSKQSQSNDSHKIMERRRTFTDCGHYYNVVWQHCMPLGLSLRGTDKSSGYPSISRISGTGCTARLPQSAVGDWLVSVNTHSVHRSDKSFEEVKAMLKTLDKPLTLTFKARGIEMLPLEPSSTE